MIALGLMGTSVMAASETVLATVNGIEITEGFVNEMIVVAPGRPTYDKLNPEMKKRSLDQAIDRMLLTNLAKKENVQKTPEFKETLKKFTEGLYVEIWLRKKADEITVPAKDVREFYDKNKDKFVQPERVKARHILVNEEQEAIEVIKELQKAGNLESAFIELAKSKSQGPSAPKGGDLGWFGKGQMVPAFEAEAFSLKKGSFSAKPVKTRFGYHVVYLEEKAEGGAVSFESVKNRIEAQMKTEKFKTTVSDITGQMKQKAKITYSK